MQGKAQEQGLRAADGCHEAGQSLGKPGECQGPTSVRGTIRRGVSRSCI